MSPKYKNYDEIPKELKQKIRELAEENKLDAYDLIRIFQDFPLPWLEKILEEGSERPKASPSKH